MKKALNLLKETLLDLWEFFLAEPLREIWRELFGDQ